MSSTVLDPFTMQKPRGVYHHGDLRQALINEAMACVETLEAEEISLAAIARTLKVSQAAPYRHFADRAALLSEVATLGFEEFLSRLKTATAGKKGREAILAECAAYFDFGTSRPGLYKLMFASPLIVPKRGKLQTKARRSFRHLIGIVEASGHANPDKQAMKIWLSLHGMVMLAIHGLLDANPVRLRRDQILELVSGG